jgi:hypothetical protein
MSTLAYHDISVFRDTPKQWGFCFLAEVGASANPSRTDRFFSFLYVMMEAMIELFNDHSVIQHLSM